MGADARCLLPGVRCLLLAYPFAAVHVVGCLLRSYGCDTLGISISNFDTSSDATASEVGSITGSIIGSITGSMLSLALTDAEIGEAARVRQLRD